MWPFPARKVDRSRRWELDQRLFGFSKADPFTIGNSFEGVLAMGATGSGKTTGSGQCLAKSYLAAGYGGLVLCAKADERRLWESYCREVGRLEDLIVFAPESPWRFNFLNYERSRQGKGAGLTDNILNTFDQLMQISERQSSGGGGDSEGYWKRAVRQLMRNSLDLLMLAREQVSVPNLYRLVVSAPLSMEQVRSAGWKSSSYCFHCMQAADANAKSPSQERDFALVADYVLCEYPTISERTRSVIVSSFTSVADTLNRGVLREMFGGDTNITPEAISDGKIIVIDLPVKEFGDVGQFAQVLWKQSFQKSIERRNCHENPRPVFLWMDEAQFFITTMDFQFVSTCRSSRVATVFLTQNVSNVYATLGGNDKGKAEVDSLFANLNCKILHANGDPVTNDWAASLIGRSRQFFVNSSNSYEPEDVWRQGWLPSAPRTSSGISEQMEFEVQPRSFTLLRKGGPANQWEVDGIVFQGGRRFQATGKTWMNVAFSQRW